MPAQPPLPEDLQRIAAQNGFQLGEKELQDQLALITGAMAVYARLDELPDVNLPVKFPRTEQGSRPTGAANPINGWVWKGKITGAASGPLARRTVAVKDCVMVAGWPMLNGSPVMEGYVPREDATVVTRLLEAGADIIGKSAVPAFCFDGAVLTAYPDPQPVNPHDHSRTTGGSSSGSAGLVANGEVDLAVGGDQGGSIRVPSAWCGTVGLKPTFGLVPYTGAFPIENTIDYLGPITSNVADNALMLEVMAGPDGLDARQTGIVPDRYTDALDRDLEGIRIGVLNEGFGWDGAEVDVESAVHDAVGALGKMGATVSEVSIPWHLDAQVIWAGMAAEGAAFTMITSNGMGSGWRGHYSVDLVDFYHRARMTRAQDYADTVKNTLLQGAYISERYGRRYYAKSQNLARLLRNEYDSAFDDVDVLVMPTAIYKAPTPLPKDAPMADRFVKMLNMLHNTCAFDVTGHPALTVPCGMSEGLPIGLQLVARHGAESTLYRVAHHYEQNR